MHPPSRVQIAWTLQGFAVRHIRPLMVKKTKKDYPQSKNSHRTTQRRQVSRGSTILLPQPSDPPHSFHWSLQQTALLPSKVSNHWVGRQAKADNNIHGGSNEEALLCDENAGPLVEKISKKFKTDGRALIQVFTKQVCPKVEGSQTRW